MCEAMRDGQRICQSRIVDDFVVRGPLATVKATLCTPHKLQLEKEHPTWIILRDK